MDTPRISEAFEGAFRPLRLPLRLYRPHWITRHPGVPNRIEAQYLVWKDALADGPGGQPSRYIRVVADAAMETGAPGALSEPSRKTRVRPAFSTRATARTGPIGSGAK